MREWQCSEDGIVYVGDPSLGERQDVADVFSHRELIVAAPNLLHACKLTLLILERVIEKAEGKKMSTSFTHEQSLYLRDLVLELNQENEDLGLAVERAWGILHQIPELNIDDERPWVKDLPDGSTLHQVDEYISEAYHVLSGAKAEKRELESRQGGVALDEDSLNARMKPDLPDDQFEEIRLNIGWKRLISSGNLEEFLKPVAFRGRQLSELTTYEGSDDSRGCTETLYEVDDGRLIVHISDWSNWQGESSYYNVEEVEESDLRPGGEFEQLGFESNLSDALSLDEALIRSEQGAIDRYRNQ
jgi:hypothetical protein